VQYKERSMKKRYSSGSSWEASIGYSRAIQSDNTLYVSATAASGPDGSIVGDDLYTQTKTILDKLGTVLTDAGFGYQDVVQSRVYVTDIAHWQDAGRAHGEVFGDVRPALTLLHVLPFVDPKILVEIEITAVKSDSAW
jgi:enamine deaminase RidA (YjgF/YER057c/UK114 family)